MPKTITLAEWRKIVLAAEARAERIKVMRMDRARQACREAGLDPSIIGVHVHNALVSAAYGKPWPNVDYSKARLANRLMEQSFEPGRIAERLSSRLWKLVRLP